MQEERLPEDYTICAYMRLSQEDTDIFGRKVESGSITSQRRLIMSFIGSQPEFKGCRVIERCDDGLSGRYFDTRPQFTDMIGLAKKGKVNCVIVKDFSRFGRDYVELGDYLEQLFPFLGVRFISINDHYDSDRDDAGLDVAFKNLVYDIYSRDLSKKVTLAKRRAAEQGKFNSVQAPFGYRRKKDDKYSLEIDPETAPIVREMYDLRLAGVSNTEIAKKLNERGVKCPTAFLHERGDRIISRDNYEMMCWTCSAVRQLLEKEVYTGTVVSLRTRVDRSTGKSKLKPESEWVKVRGRHEAIVTQEEFDRVRAMKRSKKTSEGGKRVHYRCGICGRTLGRRHKNVLYCCRGNAFRECDCKKVVVRQDEVNDVVLGTLKEKLQAVLGAEEMVIKDCLQPPVRVSQPENLKKALENARRGKQALMHKLAGREISREDFLEAKKKFDAEIAELEQRYTEAAAAERILRDGEEQKEKRLSEVKSVLDVKEMTEDMWEKFVEDVRVYPDKRLEIRWRFEDGLAAG